LGTRRRNLVDVAMGLSNSGPGHIERGYPVWKSMTGLDAGRSVLMARSDAADLAIFEANRARLVALAYRMLGDIGRAEDMVQEADEVWDEA
jgi:Sigma-70 region 2